MDIFVPLTVSFIHSAPWFTSELPKLENTRCRLERFYTKTGLIVHKTMYQEQMGHFKGAMSTANIYGIYVWNINQVW